jgi:hypothetical protein
LTAGRKNIFNILSLAILAFFSFLMLRIIALYIPVQNDAAFLQLKQSYIHITAWRVAFFIHVFSSILALLAGFTQFSKKLLGRYPLLHRRLGYMYVVNILLVTGPASLLMSFYANGGISSRIAFVLLAVGWMGFTAVALYKAVSKDFIAHRIYMIRSFALTLSAITLRIWKVVLANYTDVPPMDRYRMIAWLGWVLNILAAEYIIFKYVRRPRRMNVIH